MADLSGLIERVEQATGADDLLIAEVICAAEGKPFGGYYIGCGDDGSDELQVRTPTEEWVWYGYRHLAPDVSVDAALELIERVLPGYSLSVVIDENGAKVSLGNGVKPAVRSACPTPPLALCLALLKALQSKEGEG